MLLSVIEEKPMVNLSFPLAQANIKGERRGGGGVLAITALSNQPPQESFSFGCLAEARLGTTTILDFAANKLQFIFLSKLIEIFNALL